MSKTMLRKGIACCIAAGMAVVPLAACDPASVATDAVKTAAVDPVASVAQPQQAYAGSAAVSTSSVYSTFTDSAAQDFDGIKVDTSHASEGYVGVKGTSGNRLKVQVKLDETYNYDLSTDGKANFYPLNQGDGTYTITVFRNVSDSRYAEVAQTTVDVKMTNDYQPYLHNTLYVNYSSSSKLVKKAKSLTKKKKTDTKKVAAIYKWLTKKIKYDYNKAKTVESGYIPDPNATFKSKKGICFDFASLAAAMMRSQGIPCRLITGYVAPNDVYHSWNMIYVQKKGWISKEIKASNNKWGRIDVTYAATGADAKFVGNGKNYVTRYTY